MAKRDDIKKVDDISNEGSRYDNLKSTAKVINITERFDDTTHNDNPYDDAIQYLAKKVEDVIEESNLQGTASGSYATDIKTLTLASGSFSTRVTRNDAKSTAAVSNSTGDSVTLTLSDTGLVFTIGRSTYTVRRDG